MNTERYNFAVVSGRCRRQVLVYIGRRRCSPRWQIARAAFRFPGSLRTYDDCLAQVTDAHALARASLWAATAEQASGQAFNYVHPPFRWRRVWEKVAKHFGLEVGEPIPFALATHMPALEPVWQATAGVLVKTDFSKAVGWGFGDFIFGTEADVISDMTKIRLAGFSEDLDAVDALIRAIERQQAGRVIPLSTGAERALGRRGLPK